jgi:rhodanese-related sulfurtransferase
MREELILVTVIAIAIGWFVFNGYKQGKEFEKFDKGNALFIDVRTPAEFHQGSIDGALNFPVQQLSFSMDELKKLSDDGETQLVLFCRSGVRSSNAYRQLTKAGMSNLLDGGGYASLRSRLFDEQEK